MLGIRSHTGLNNTVYNNIIYSNGVDSPVSHCGVLSITNSRAHVRRLSEVLGEADIGAYEYGG
jgi:hypothetical protein